MIMIVITSEVHSGPVVAYASEFHKHNGRSKFSCRETCLTILDIIQLNDRLVTNALILLLQRHLQKGQEMSLSKDNV